MFIVGDVMDLVLLTRLGRSNGVLPNPLTLPALLIFPSGINMTFPYEVGGFKGFIELFKTVILERSIVRPVLETNFAVELGFIVKFSKTTKINQFILLK